MTLHRWVGLAAGVATILTLVLYLLAYLGWVPPRVSARLRLLRLGPGPATRGSRHGGWSFGPKWIGEGKSVKCLPGTTVTLVKRIGTGLFPAYPQTSGALFAVTSVSQLKTQVGMQRYFTDCCVVSKDCTSFTVQLALGSGIRFVAGNQPFILSLLELDRHKARISVASTAAE